MMKGNPVPASNHDAMGSAWVSGQSKNFADFLLLRFGARRFADMHRAAIAAAQRGGDALLTRQSLAYRIPCVIDAFVFELQPHRMHEMIGQHADKQMAFDPAFYMMVNRAQAQIGLETSSWVNFR